MRISDWSSDVCSSDLVALTLPRTRSSGTKTERTAPSSRLAGLSVGFLLVAAFMGMVSILGSLFAPFFLIGIGISDPNVQAYPLMAMAAAGMAASSFYGFLHGRIDRKSTRLNSSH